MSQRVTHRFVIYQTQILELSGPKGGMLNCNNENLTPVLLGV